MTMATRDHGEPELVETVELDGAEDDPPVAVNRYRDGAVMVGQGDNLVYVSARQVAALEAVLEAHRREREQTPYAPPPGP